MGTTAARQQSRDAARQARARATADQAVADQAAAAQEAADQRQLDAARAARQARWRANAPELRRQIHEAEVAYTNQLRIRGLLNSTRRRLKEATKGQQQDACRTVCDRKGSLQACDLCDELASQGFTITMVKAMKAVDKFNRRRSKARKQEEDQFQAAKAAGQARAAGNHAQWDANRPELNRLIHEAENARNQAQLQYLHQDRHY